MTVEIFDAPPPDGRRRGDTSKYAEYVLAAQANPGKWVAVPATKNMAVRFRQAGFAAVQRGSDTWISTGQVDHP